MPVGADLNKQKSVDNRILKRTSTTDKASYRWWLDKEEDKLLGSLFMVADRIRENLKPYRRQNFIYQMMYNDVDTNLYASQGGSTIAERGAGSAANNKITLNVVQNCIDTAAALIAKNEPKPLFITDGDDDYNDYVKAQKLTKYIDGLFDDIKLYDKMERVFTDGAIYGTGAIKFYVDYDKKRVCAEWVNLNEILVDALDGLKEEPTQMMQEKWISRDELIERFPDCADKIMAAESGMKSDVSMRTTADVIPVLEAWHLKSGSKAKDGRHIIAVRNVILVDEQYDKDYYPIRFWRWYHQTSGFWGRGICQEIGKQQRTLNKIMQTIDLAQELVGVPLIVSPKSAMIAEDHMMSNAMARWIEYFGDVPPQFLTPPAIQQELYNYRREIIQEMYEVVGINRGMAQGTKDPDLKSGAAIREATDIAAGRFQKIGQRWERTFTDLAMVAVDLSKDLYEEHPDLTITVKDNDRMKTIAWKDVDMDKDRFKIDVFEISGLPNTPQGRIEMLTEWGANGWIPKEVMMSVLNIPDLKRYSNLETSTSDLVQQTVSKIKETGEYTNEMKPIEQQNLDLSLSLASMELTLAKVQGLPEDVLYAIKQYVDDVGMLKQKQQQLMQPPPPPPGAEGPPQIPGPPPPMQLSPPK